MEVRSTPRLTCLDTPLEAAPGGKRYDDIYIFTPFGQWDANLGPTIKCSKTEDCANKVEYYNTFIAPACGLV
ncbi:hypothetical protein E2C01_097891 [Portunus trituberculatus]|uniref:Uncharacterized protein n=1 Tax=Portunus trituberculatus TaxID=210409 RepID=A0A5B7K6U6_PORTR|nr:hypothetical protein [Portunus trituberculatus]